MNTVWLFVMKLIEIPYDFLNIIEMNYSEVYSLQRLWLIHSLTQSDKKYEFFLKQNSNIRRVDGVMSWEAFLKELFLLSGISLKTSIERGLTSPRIIPFSLWNALKYKWIISAPFCKIMGFKINQLGDKKIVYRSHFEHILLFNFRKNSNIVIFDCRRIAKYII